MAAPGAARRLYRRILQLHRALPPALRDLGDRYVKEEFRRHRAAGPAEAQRFLREWEMVYWATWSLHRLCDKVLDKIIPVQKLHITEDTKPKTSEAYTLSELDTTCPRIEDHDEILLSHWKPQKAQAFYLRPEMKLINLSGENLKDCGCYHMKQKAFSDLYFGLMYNTGNYAALIQQQINEDKQNLREKTVYGLQLTEEKLNDFRDEQIGQLKELMDEATKPNKKINISKDSKYKN